MKSSLVRIGVFCLLALLLTTSCQTAKKASIPVTGGDAASAPAQVEAARNNIVEYLISSDRLDNTPPRTGWQLDIAHEGEYHFSYGDWVMVVWSANTQEQDERVVLRNTTTGVVWCGYVQPDGHVVDTSYLP